MTVCTIDVHSRDVISKMISLKVESSTAFQWQAQLRHRWDFKIKDCFGNICDAQFRYDYEYLGCTPRLVITPLTDRCYITLTQVGDYHSCAKVVPTILTCLILVVASYYGRSTCRSCGNRQNRNDQRFRKSFRNYGVCI